MIPRTLAKLESRCTGPQIGYQDQANLDSSEAGYATSAGFMNAAGAIVGGASKAYGQGMFGNSGGGGRTIPGT